MELLPFSVQSFFENYQSESLHLQISRKRERIVAEFDGKSEKVCAIKLLLLEKHIDVVLKHKDCFKTLFLKLS